ncbi:MAG TPA: bifunctional lysylphosphatidylglycerol flippase/synthetase MprF [Gemmatimonadaceae bacterium]|nr:bifunctional lysylphosphatidylglycerol flippase/synthetase MprF [Gemmatimonadaceae bacterium]
MRPEAAHALVMRIHYLVPSLLGTLLFLLIFFLWKKEPLIRLVRISGQWGAVIVPRVLAATTFLAGMILLFSGATPAVGNRLYWLHRVLPLPVIEVSHLFGSLAGAGLLILARGIQRRLDAAYHLTVALLAAGVLFSLLKAFDYEEAILLTVMLAALVPNRRYFYRKASIIEERFTRGWIAAIALAVLGSIAFGIILYHNGTYRNEAFWHFGFQSQGPRFLRATAGAVALLVIFAVARLIRPARPPRTVPSAQELHEAATIVERSPEAASHLALLGDKALLFNAQRTGFVMYGQRGRSWVALGDPVAAHDESVQLVLDFVALADQHGGWPVFYKVGREQLSLYLDLGFSVTKLGEEARVHLAEFSLEGPDRGTLRRLWRKSVKDGCSFQLLEPSDVRQHMDELRAISEQWMAEKKVREKGFSLGAFSQSYVRRYPVGLVRFQGAAVAFATIWPSGCHQELEVDLMRFSPAAPPGIMRYLLTELILWGRAQEYVWFNLGMAPLSGLRTSTVAPLWNQITVAVYGHGERFYNFQGIRRFKEWFHPVWEPRYLVSPGGASRPLILANIASLIAGGLEGVVRR